LAVVEVYALDGHRSTEERRLERHLEVILDHRKQPNGLLGLAVGIDDRFLDQLVEPAPTQLRSRLAPFPPHGPTIPIGP
jgi:hypothetical protein